MSDFTVEVSVTELVKGIGQMRRRGYHLQPLNMTLAQAIHLLIEEKFEHQGPGWQPFAESTLRRRRASQTPRLLQDTGDLVNSLQPYATNTYAEVRTNKEYASYHILGDGVPKRDFFDVDLKEAMADYEAMIVSVLKD